METTRLIINCFNEIDIKNKIIDDFINLIKDKMQAKMAPYDDQFPTDEDSIKQIFNYFLTSRDFFGVFLKTTSQLVGYLTLNYIDDDTRNLGYNILSTYQNQGYATEACEKIISYAKHELHLKKLIAGTALVNEPSVKLLKHLGFELVKQEEGSFTNNEKGEPITFIGGSFVRIL